LSLVIQIPPGYSDQSHDILDAGLPAYGLEVARIYDNGVFGLARTEIFVTGPHQNKEVVPIPVSPIDGYVYERSELIYLWSIQNTVDKATGWITGKDSLWHFAHLVDQNTGEVLIDTWYRRSGLHALPALTHDGTLTVWTIAQRQKSNLIIAQSPTYAAISSGWIAVDEPWQQQLARGLNDDAKFSVVNKEVFYLGEYYNGQSVTLPVSPADGYSYGSGECKFIFSWRWTPDGTLAQATNPPFSDGQLGPITADVSGGSVTISVTYIDDFGSLVPTTDGKIAVFAFCQRSGTPGSISPPATNFAEISFGKFMPGRALEYPDVQQILDNTLQAIVTPEYFGPTTHNDGDTVPLPTSPIDGYAYSRAECTYVWAFTDTTMASGSNLRMASFGGDVNQNTGVVTLYGYRLPPGGPYVSENTSLPTITVLTVARRAQAAPNNVPLPAYNGVTGPGTQAPQTDYNVGGNKVVDQPFLNGLLIEQLTPCNSSNTHFTITSAFPTVAVMLIWNGEIILPGTGKFTLAGLNITTSFTDAQGNAIPPDTGDTLYALIFF
jgi:hypothetical protein